MANENLDCIKPGLITNWWDGIRYIADRLGRVLPEAGASWVAGT